MIRVPDDLNAGQAYNRLQVILSDPQARQYVGALAYHLYGGSSSDKNNIKQLSKQYGIPVWMTEWSNGGNNGMGWANTIHDHVSQYGISALDYMWGYFGQWEPSSTNLITLKYSGAQYLGYELNKHYYTMGQYSRFVRPGSQRIEAISTDQAVKVTAYKDGQDIIVVAINNGGTKTVQFNLNGISDVTRVNPIRTSETENWAVLDSIAVSGSTFMAILSANSITTFINNPSADNQPPSPPKNVQVQLKE